MESILRSGCREILRSSHFRAASAVLVLTLVLYLPGLSNGFVNWDDPLYVTANLHIKKIDKAMFRWTLTSLHGGNWHPLTSLSHAIDYAIWGLNPLGHHLSSIVLHVMNTLIVFILVVRLIRFRLTYSVLSTDFSSAKHTVYIAAITSLLFGIHPLHVESVAWISERKDVLSSLFYLMSLLFYIEYLFSLRDVRPKLPFKNRHYLLSLGLFLMSLCSKPMAVSLPFVLLIIDWYPGNRFHRGKSAARCVQEKIPFLALTVGAVILTLKAQYLAQAVVPFSSIQLNVRILLALKSLLDYLLKILIPLNLTHYYPYPLRLDLLSPGLLVPALLMLAIIICLIAMRRYRLWASTIGYYIVTILPVLGIIKVGNQLMADRYMYLPSLGPFLLIGIGVVLVLRKLDDAKRWRSLAYGAATSALISCFLALSFLTVRQIHVWKNSVTLWSRLIEVNPAHLYIAKAYLLRGDGFLEQSEYSKALLDYQEAIRLSPALFQKYLDRCLKIPELQCEE